MIYDLIATLLRPVAWWGRLRVEGLEAAPADGPLLVVPNHDSQWDPVLAGLALRPRRRLRFLARASLWRIPGLGPLLYAMGQIPVRRGEGDAAALDQALSALRSGERCACSPRGDSPGGSDRGHAAASDASPRRARVPGSCSAACGGRPAT